MKIAEALLLRKQLEAKVEQLKPLKLNGDAGVYKDEVHRININESIDEITLKVARVDINSLTKTYDTYASELRKLDAALQKANWQYDIEFNASTEISK